MEKENDKEDKKSDKQEDDKKEDKKALFIQRLVAFVLDIFIVSVVASIVGTPFVDVERSNELSSKSLEIIQNYDKTDLKTYSLEVMDVSYKMARNNGMLSIITIVLEILYFVVFQVYNCGQTLGKKLMKIRVVSDNDELTMNQMIFRSLIANSILVKILSFTFMTFCSKTVYFYCSGTFEAIQYIIILISLFMVMYRKDGCAIHDKLAHTKVIMVK